MKTEFGIDPLRDARAIADAVEQLAHEVQRTAKGLGAIVEDAKRIYKTVVAPVLNWLMSPGEEPPAKPQGEPIRGSRYW